MSSIVAISASWEAEIAFASSSTSGRSVSSTTASVIPRAALWCGIISRRKSLSASSGGNSPSRRTSSGAAMPGMRPCVGMPIQPMAGPVPVGGRRQTESQPCIWPIWACCVRDMSEAKTRISESSVRSRTISAISTACAWWTDMSLANPASLEPSAGGRSER